MQGTKKKMMGGNKTVSPLRDLITVRMQKNQEVFYYALGKMQCAGVGDPPHMINGESHHLIQVPKVDDALAEPLDRDTDGPGLR